MEDQEKTCVICLQNYEDCENFKFIPLATTVVNNETYLNKIHYMTLEDDLDEVFQEHWEVCPDCSDDLIKTCEFKRKLTNAVEFWKNYHIVIGDSKEVVSANEGDTDKVQSNELLVEEIKSESDKSECHTFVCESCLQVFQTTSDVVNHTCSQNTEVKTSETTDKECTVPKNHVETTRISAKSNRCTFCNKLFRHQCSLREHINSHTKEHEYSCNECGKIFHRLSSRNRHKKSHLAPPGEKAKKCPFLCSICGRSFPYSNGFQRHMRIHFAEKRHKCKICDRAFSQSTHLKVHLRTHSGEKPYICFVCKGAFALKSTLQKHMKGHNG